MARRMCDRPLVYVAGPYAHPDPVRNTHEALRFGTELNDTGMFVAFVPHISLLWHIVTPRDEDHWYELDLAYLARCDALFRLPGKSKGADAEEEFARQRGIPVFYETADLWDWLPEWQTA